MKELTETEYLHKMAAYCSRAERCEQDVRQKMTGLSFEGQNRILERLRKEKFIDEQRYALSFVKDKFRFNQWGRIKIAHALRQKGVASDKVDEALSVINDEAYEATLRSLLATKRRTIKEGEMQKLYAKLFRFAASRGFESNLIGRVLKEIIHVEEDLLDME